jgi:hypothetical protein
LRSPRLDLRREKHYSNERVVEASSIKEAPLTLLFVVDWLLRIQLVEYLPFEAIWCWSKLFSLGFYFMFKIECRCQVFYKVSKSIHLKGKLYHLEANCCEVTPPLSSFVSLVSAY